MTAVWSVLHVDHELQFLHLNVCENRADRTEIHLKYQIHLKYCLNWAQLSLGLRFLGHQELKDCGSYWRWGGRRYRFYGSGKLE